MKSDAAPMSWRHARRLTNTAGVLHKENGLLTWWNVLKAAAAHGREEAWRDQPPTTSNSKLSSRAASLSPSAFCPDGKSPGDLLRSLFIYFPDKRGNLLLLLLLSDSDGARYVSLPADDDLGAEFSGRANKEMKFGEGAGGAFTDSYRRAGAPAPLYRNYRGAYKGGKKDWSLRWNYFKSLLTADFGE